ncbi:MAG: phosphatidic acid phosphatase, partial [Candidatus Arcticimaribacter sp.]
MYPTIAAYEIMAQAYPQNYKSLAGQLKDLEKISPMTQDVNPHLATLYAYNFVGKALIFSEDKMDDFQRKQAMKIKAIGVPRRVRKASLAYAEKVSAHILNWANGDLYNQTRTFSRYTIQEEDHFWKPTPPDYMDGIEPHWNKIRTLVIDSANQYQPKAPLSFDLSKGSPFQKQLQQVYDISKVLTDEQVEIAKFWDCNPYLTHHRGHAMFATKRLLLEGTGSGLLPSLPEKHKVILPKR